MLSGAKRRLCIVNPYEHGGGAEYQISLLIDALAAAGRYEVHYLAHFVDERTRARNYRIHHVGRKGPMPPLGYILDARSLFRTLRAIEPDVIYQRVACGYTGLCAWYAQRHSIPMVWHVAHDTDVAPQILDAARNFVRLRLEKRLVEYGARHATRVVVQTRQQAALLRTHYRRSADAVIGNFHPPAAQAAPKNGPRTVVWIANLKPWKQPEVFVRLAQALADRGDVRFIMVGAPAAHSANHEWQDALLRSIEATPNLSYVGHKTHDEVNELLAHAHIFVNTSTQEGFPNTFIQAWLRSVAVVSLTVDPDQVLERLQVGIATQTESALITAVRRLLDDAEECAAYARRGRLHAAANHSLHNAGELIRLIDAACSQIT